MYLEPYQETELPQPLESEYQEVAWAVTKYGGAHTPIFISRPKVTEFQVRFEMLYCGICHSDCHCGRNDWGGCVYPFVGGHELLGQVVEIGEKVTKVKVGDYCAVGVIVDSCLQCKHCKLGDENYCEKGMIETYNGEKKYGRIGGNQKLRTFGGYSASQVTHEHFIVKIPLGMDLDKTAPILCAGITMYSPLKHWGYTTGEKKTVGIVGVGGLGTMGIKIANSLGHQVVAISTSANKEILAKQKGAHLFVVSSNPESIKQHAGICDIILNTITVPHDLNLYLNLLSTNGVLVQIGGVVESLPVSQVSLMMTRKTIAGSLIGGIEATQEVVDLCFKHKIYPDCQILEAKDIDWAWDQLSGNGKNADGIRYVIDIKKSLQNKDFLPK